MTDRIVVLVPFWAEPGSWRDRIFWEAVRPNIQVTADLLGAQVIVTSSGHQPFSVGNSFNKAARMADDRHGRWDVALLHEADFLVRPDALVEAVRLVQQGYQGLAYGWSRHMRLTEEGTNLLLAGKRTGFQHRRHFRLGSPFSPGGPRAIRREVWDAVSGFHPGFVGWGYEDNHLAWKCQRAAGPPLRVAADLLNSWHPRRRDAPDDPYFAATTANFELWTRLQEGEADR